MADVTQDPASVRAGTGAITELVQAGEAFDAGTPVYFDDDTGKYYEADADDSNKYQASGIALTGADADGDRFVIQTGGEGNIGGTTIKGEIYILSATAGSGGYIAPASDLGSGWYPCVIGTAKNTGGDLEYIFEYGSVSKS